MLVVIANREDHDQTTSEKQSDLGLHCLSAPFWQAISVRNFSIFIKWKRSGSAVECLTEGPRVRTSPPSLRSGP